MKIPNFKPIKWKLEYCTCCKVPIGRHSWACRGPGDHNIIKRDNVPFFSREMKIMGVGWKGWVTVKDLASGMKAEISSSNFSPIVLKYGINPGGVIPNKWWIWCKVGGTLSLRILSDEY